MAIHQGIQKDMENKEDLSKPSTSEKNLKYGASWMRDEESRMRDEASWKRGEESWKRGEARWKRNVAIRTQRA